MTLLTLQFRVFSRHFFLIIKTFVVWKYFYQGDDCTIKHSRVGQCLPNGHMTTSKVKHHDEQWQRCLWILASMFPQFCRKAAALYQFTIVPAAVSHRCSDMNLQLSQPAQETISVTTNIHPCARSKSILVPAPRYRNLALFSLICKKKKTQHWLTSQGS